MSANRSFLLINEGFIEAVPVKTMSLVKAASHFYARAVKGVDTRQFFQLLAHVNLLTDRT
jgi:hypothetical protein